MIKRSLYVGVASLIKFQRVERCCFTRTRRAHGQGLASNAIRYHPVSSFPLPHPLRMGQQGRYVAENATLLRFFRLYRKREKRSI